jgi:hypothetical protein
VSSLVALQAEGCGMHWMEHQIHHGVTKLVRRRSDLERRAAEGDGPVSECNQPPSADPK